MNVNLNKFDTSNYPNQNIFNIPRVNTKVAGLMKDECDGKILAEFVGLRSKMYSIKVENRDFIKKIKLVVLNMASTIQFFLM